VPHIDTADQARAFVEAAKFAPLGKRGMYTSRQGYGVADYVHTANDHTLLVALIEDIQAVQNLDAILEVDHIDVFFVAPSDLAASMGKIGKLADPEVVRTIDETLARIVAAGRTAGTLLSNNQGAERFLALDVRFLACSVLPMLSAGIRDLKQQVGI
jgi:4-hydroxy-2-oxoheptanedioate aldolase